MRGRYADPAYRQRLALRGCRRYQRETAEERWDKAITYWAEVAGLSEARNGAVRDWLARRGNEYLTARGEFIRHGYAHRLSALVIAFRMNPR
jgi:hypothetical protein